MCEESPELSAGAYWAGKALERLTLWAGTSTDSVTSFASLLGQQAHANSVNQVLAKLPEFYSGIRSPQTADELRQRLLQVVKKLGGSISLDPEEVRVLRDLCAQIALRTQTERDTPSSDPLIPIPFDRTMSMAKPVIILPGVAITDLLVAARLSYTDLAANMQDGKRRLYPIPTETLVRDLERQEKLNYPLSVCFHDTAGRMGLVWGDGQWIPQPEH